MASALRGGNDLKKKKKKKKIYINYNCYNFCLKHVCDMKFGKLCFPDFSCLSWYFKGIFMPKNPGNQLNCGNSRRYAITPLCSCILAKTERKKLFYNSCYRDSRFYRKLTNFGRISENLIISSPRGWCNWEFLSEHVPYMIYIYCESFITFLYSVKMYGGIPPPTRNNLSKACLK